MSILIYEYPYLNTPNLLDVGRLSLAQHRAAVAVLKQKCRVYAGGCRKRGRRAEADRYEQLSQDIPDDSRVK